MNKQTAPAQVGNARTVSADCPRLARFALLLLAWVTPITATTDEASFLQENEKAMSKMMAAMDIKPLGDVDADFVAMMVPHHQGAVDMALAQLRYGKNEKLRRLAQEIIITQQQEIVAMKLALATPSSESGTSPTEPQRAVASGVSAEHGGLLHVH